MEIAIKKNTLRIAGIIFFIAVVIFLTKGFGLFSAGISGSAINVEGEIKIPLLEILEDAQWYEYNSGRTIIKFFAVKAGDGSIKTGFDACDVCYGSRKGYRQEGKYMICNNCGNKYPINGLGTENKNPGGCWPGYLPSSIEGNELVIKKSDLEKGKWRF